jgi:hypothetical protein
LDAVQLSTVFALINIKTEPTLFPAVIRAMIEFGGHVLPPGFIDQKFNFDVSNSFTNWEGLAFFLGGGNIGRVITTT